MSTLAEDTFVDAETTIERFASVQFSSGTKLTTNEVIEFAVGIAQEMVAEMAVIGHTRVPPGTGAVEPETTLLRECNAAGAAFEAVAATFAANRAPNRTTHADGLEKTYKRKLKQLLGYLKNTAIDVRSTDHLQEGDIVPRTDTTLDQQDDIFKLGDDI